MTKQVTKWVNTVSIASDKGCKGPQQAERCDGDSGIGETKT